MTMSNKSYYDEIIGALREDYFKLRHFILYVERGTIEKRLGKRLDLKILGLKD